ncbi:MAG: DUF1922 domain-containing protein [Candidatus Lokiarchaeota archaeon]|nr:DUF1922 domain-containing protein [Candidatus Lokiarchaeota archaeon]
MTDYIVFQCTKCNQYTYAKTTQKGKKCPRCGRNHIINKVNGELVNAPTKAMELVKYNQNQINSSKSFNSTKKPIPIRTPSSSEPLIIPIIAQDAQLTKLLQKVIEWQRNENISFKEGFPEYIIEYIVQEIELESRSRTILIRKLHQLKQFTRLEGGNIYIEETY